MIKVGYDGIPLLSELFEKYAEKAGVSAWNKAADFMCTVCQIDKEEGSNRQFMSIEKLVTADDEIWREFITTRVGLQASDYGTPLPRVQKERLFLDYLLWMIYGVIKGGRILTYCCESTPKAIDRATDAVYKTEEELGEVYDMLYRELQSADIFEPSLSAINMLKSSAALIKVLKDIETQTNFSTGYDVDSWATTTFKRAETGMFSRVKMILPNSLLDSHNSLRLLGEFVPDADFFAGRDELKEPSNFEIYAKQCLSSLLHNVIRFAYATIQRAYSTNEYNANYIMNCLLTKFSAYLPVGTLSLDNIAPSVNPPGQMHIVARSKCQRVFSSGSDMCSIQSIIGLFGVLFMYGLKKGNTTVTPETVIEQLGIEKYGFWRW